MNSPKKPTATDKSNGLLRGNVFFSFSFFFLSFLFPFFPPSRHKSRHADPPVSIDTDFTTITYDVADVASCVATIKPAGKVSARSPRNTGYTHRCTAQVCVCARVERGGGGWHERCNSLWRRGGASGATQLSINIFTAV